MLIFLIFSQILLLVLGVVNAQSPKIAPSLKEKLDKGEKVNVLVSFEGGVGDECRLSVPAATSRSIVERGQALNSIVDNLVGKMDDSQSGVLQLLSSRTGESAPVFTQFWLTNQIFVKQADLTLVDELADDPKVAEIIAEPVIELFQDSDVPPHQQGGPLENDAPQPNLVQIKVPEAWELMGGNKGEGILIGFMDGGARGTHEILKDNFIGEYGWYDPLDMKSEPWDAPHTGHGTHVTGLAVGSKGIGVAPGAKWAACRICGGADPPCPLEAVVKCAQFFTCPTFVDGTKHDCSKAPRIINNSWGGPFEGSTTYFDDMLLCWKAAGIIPVFAIGNYGGKCESAQYPGTLADVIAVGNVDEVDSLSGGSSRGPAPDGRIKPDVVAPGVWVVSSTETGDADYKKRVGTSFAAPHVAGAIALLLARHNELNYDQVRELIVQSVDQLVLNDSRSVPCGDVPLDVFPNNLVGYGRLNVLRLLEMADAAAAT